MLLWTHTHTRTHTKKKKNHRLFLQVCAGGSRSYSPPLLCDDHLCLVPVKLQPQGPVAQIHLRLPRHQSCLRGGELVKSPSLVRVSILLRVRVARRRVALGRSVGQKAVVSSISYDRVMGHVAAGTPDRESRVRWSMLARVGEHGTGSC